MKAILDYKEVEQDWEPPFNKKIDSQELLVQQGTKIGKTDFSSMMSHQMTYLMPIVTVFISWTLPAGLPLYWAVITLFGIIQQYFTKTIKLWKKMNNSEKKILDACCGGRMFCSVLSSILFLISFTISFIFGSPSLKNFSLSV